MGANPSLSNLLVGVVACPENTGVECEGDNSGDVGCVECELCGMLGMVSADMRVVKGIAGGLCIDG